ncbi:MAG: PaaI family thioesterase [Desulfatiglandaceae bacterium]
MGPRHDLVYDVCRESIAQVERENDVVVSSYVDALHLWGFFLESTGISLKRKQMRGVLMSDKEKVDIEKPKGHYCFACGTANPIGLDLQFYRRGDTVCSDIRLSRYHEGWENIAHGGIISTLLDEIMSWAVMCAKKSFFVTRKMSVKYIKNVPIEKPLKVIGMLTNDSAPPKVAARAEIRDEAGGLLVRSRGEFILLPEKNLASVPETYKEEMHVLFQRLG